MDSSSRSSWSTRHGEVGSNGKVAVARSTTSPGTWRAICTETAPGGATHRRLHPALHGQESDLARQAKETKERMLQAQGNGGVLRLRQREPIDRELRGVRTSSGSSTRHTVMKTVLVSTMTICVSTAGA